MKKIKSGISVASGFICFKFLKAQTIEEGKKFLYYERYKSAKDVFEKLVNANPNNADAVYWLGQTLIAPMKISRILQEQRHLSKNIDGE